ncbi:MAG: DNA repair protein [Alteromonas sp.]|uniref:DNA repair protein n=1 Tax=Alteromonas australica TaxID=589873 RepID=A0A358DZ25_9ALTE|nr:phospholipase D family protein [Alteromonas australica]MBU32571.1 DNA repair protein [Alteromonas sp.]HBU51468.1 DNA repair protein [Alteromonas australica]|tara:strand:+ start:188 stop:904 length:717 start_codon:yes stop_codon:yes gene_type:complete
MAKFLNTSATNYFLEELIKNASERLILISPFLKLNDRIKELLEDKNRLKIDVRIIYGKSELQPEEINWLRSLDYVRTSFCKNLHAKCYINEQGCIITSLNLYEFSQVNNNEMGIYVDRADDSQMYIDAYEEAQRIIRISDEIRITLEKIKPEGQVNASEDGATEELISSSKIAKRLNLTTDEFINALIACNYIEERDGHHVLTQLGESIGGEHVKKSRFGPYFKWPSSFDASLLKKDK